MTLMHLMSYAIHVIASCALKHLMHCTILPLAHIRLFTLGPVTPESEVQVKQVQIEAITNLDWDQGKPWCIPPTILGFSLITIIMLCLIVH
jgi:hypothetical protein